MIADYLFDRYRLLDMPQPQTEEEFTRYFFHLIGATEGAWANDFKFVMKQLYPWKGDLLRIPENLPGAGQQLPPDAPFYGLTQQTGGDGIPDGRLWIPAAVPQVDENGNVWYTRYIQYIKDKPGGVHGVDYIWTWWYQSGNAYVPLGGSSHPEYVTRAEVQAMIDAAVKPLNDRITALEQAPQTGVQFGDKIALVTNSGLFAGIKGGGPTQVDAPIDWIGKTAAHAWESFTLEKGE